MKVKMPGYGLKFTPLPQVVTGQDQRQRHPVHLPQAM
jgi:hypothetical protein